MHCAYNSCKPVLVRFLLLWLLAYWPIASQASELLDCHTGEAFSPPAFPSRLIILVHGNSGSIFDMQDIATYLKKQQQVTACFSYTTRQSLYKSSMQLAQFAQSFNDKYQVKNIVFIGHSMGGLISRKALTFMPDTEHTKLSLVTIATPFAGVQMANGCSNIFLRVASLGLQDFACWMLTGDKWQEITSNSSFIRTPGYLPENLNIHLHIITEEKNRCRYFNGQGQCERNDFVFRVQEQQLDIRHRHINTQQIQIKAGHTEIIGKYRPVPAPLLDILACQLQQPTALFAQTDSSPTTQCL